MKRLKKQESAVCEACGGSGYVVGFLPGGISNPENKIERCDTCELYETDKAAQEAANFESGNYDKLNVADRIRAMELDVLLRLAVND